MTHETITLEEHVLKGVTEHLQNSATDDDLINLYNEMVNNTGYERIYNNDEYFFDEMFSGEVIKAIQATQYGDYRYSDRYVIHDGYANLDSFNYPSDHIDTEELAGYIVENPHIFKHEREILDLIIELEDEYTELYEDEDEDE